MVLSQFSSLGQKHIQKMLIPTGFPEDFTDTFGPLPGQPLLEPISDDSAVVYTHSQTLLGRTTCVNKLLNKLNLFETEDLLELVEGECEETTKKHIDLENPSVGLEDFEVLKVVGQGTFGKVYQVIKRGTSEIYAMKVMRKDKILEKNHAEYMKSERDILAKVNHPFIVKLRYSFQVIAY